MQREIVLGLIRSGTAECVDHSGSAPGIEILDAIPVHAVGARGDMVQVTVADQRPQPGLVDLDLLLGRGVLFRRPRARI